MVAASCGEAEMVPRPRPYQNLRPEFAHLAHPRTPCPALSVVVLNYNYACFLGECLRSILDQTFQDFEIIVLDDCSLDESLQTALPFLDDERVRLIAHENNAGFVISLVEGMETYARGEFLTIVSADDTMLRRDAFAEQLAVLANPEVAFSYTAWEYIDGGGEPLGVVRPFHDDHVWHGYEEFRELITKFYVLHSGTIVRRSSYEMAGGYDRTKRYAVDNDLWARLCATGSVGYVADCCYGYRIHEHNMSHSGSAVFLQVDEMVSICTDSFAGFPAHFDRGLRRRARKAALLSIPTMLIFAGRKRDGWRTVWYATRRHGASDTLINRRLANLVLRTLLGRKGFQMVRRVFRRGR